LEGLRLQGEVDTGPLSQLPPYPTFGKGVPRTSTPYPPMEAEACAGQVMQLLHIAPLVGTLTPFPVW